MKQLTILLTIFICVNLGQKSFAQTDSCNLCLLNGHYYSPGSIIIQKTVSNEGFGDYPFICKDGKWSLFSSSTAKNISYKGVDKIDKEILEKAISCEVCLYGNQGFSDGAILCLPDNDLPIGKLKPYHCKNGIWQLRSNTPCEN